MVPYLVLLMKFTNAGNVSMADEEAVWEVAMEFLEAASDSARLIWAGTI